MPEDGDEHATMPTVDSANCRCGHVEALNHRVWIASCHEFNEGSYSIDMEKLSQFDISILSHRISFKIFSTTSYSLDGPYSAVCNGQIRPIRDRD